MGDHFNYVDPGHPSDEIPLHPVTISPFYMSTTLLTCREYCDYLNAALAQKLIEVRSGFVYSVGGTSTATMEWLSTRCTRRLPREFMGG
jgi:formylglycine-generating enzyme required for sulfatase activity